MDGTGNNSSDFVRPYDPGNGSDNTNPSQVRKLYKMLEDPSYKDIVRWSDTGDSFVVLENEKFTKNILPKHFKHSNFASFVRQLNKYDFHKVKSSDQETGQSPYGTGAWEFKHPEFQANGKQNLDNIRRKAPAPRKANNSMDDTNFPAQQFDLVNTQLVATQHQLQHLQEKHNDMLQGHFVLLKQVVQLQKIVKNHDAVMHRVMGFLHSVDAQRRNSRPGLMSGSNGMGIADLVSSGHDDRPASPLQQASELLGEYSAENLVNKDLLDQVTMEFHRNDFATPPGEPGGSSLSGPASMSYNHNGPSSGSNNNNLNFNVDLDTMVYPIGQTNGIDPINSEHINNIPYALPPNGMMPVDNQPPPMVKPLTHERKKSMIDPGWGAQKPRILLVEDDKTCARIGCKFLQTFECGVETARDGLEAVNKINSGPNNFDLILMDIIMPHLDGVSATVCIREINMTIPIIAMTSNIRADDIDMYFRYGMNDVLPKPFTKEGMLRTLEKHLGAFKKNVAPPQNSMAVFATPAVPNPQSNLALNHMSSAHSLKDEASPGKSPSSSWHSPITGTSPASTTQGSYGQPMSQYNLTPTHGQGQFQPQHTGGSNINIQPRGAGPVPHRRAISDMSDIGPLDDRPGKRQQMYPPTQGGYH